jgi:transmembrane sensor
MRNSTIEPTREMIAEASAWLIEFRTGNPGQAERDRFSAWLRTSPHHIQAYFEVAAAWSELPDCDPEKRIDIQKMMRDALESGDANIVELGMRSKPSTPRLRFEPSPMWAAIAASVLVFLMATTAYFYSQRGVYRTGTGEQRSLILADGSSIELNAQSKIRVRYSDQERHIDLLAGQALFRVAQNKSRPFVVDTGGTQVRAVGTQFDVYRKVSGTIVTVLEGKVAVGNVLAGSSDSMEQLEPVEGAESIRREVFLAAGEQLTVPALSADTTAMTSPHPADVAVATAWTQKRLVFENTPLIEVAEEFNRYSIRHLVIVDEDLQRLGISGLYSSTDPSALIAFLSTHPSILITETETEILVTRR